MTPKQILDSFSETLMQDERILSAQERALVASLLQHAKAAASANPETHEAVRTVIASAIGETVAQRAFAVLGGSIVERIIESISAPLGEAADGQVEFMGAPTPRQPQHPGVKAPKRQSPASQPQHPGLSPATQPQHPGLSPASQPQHPGLSPALQPQHPGLSPATQPQHPGLSPASQPQHPGLSPASQPQHPGLSPATQPQHPGSSPLKSPAPPAPQPQHPGGSVTKTVVTGSSVAVRERPEVLHANCVILDEFLAPQELQALTHFALEHEADFQASEVYSPSADKGVINYSHRRSRVLMDLGEQQDLMVSRIKSVLPQVLEKLGMEEFTITDVEAQVTASNDGDFFLLHDDNGSEGVSTRHLTFVYFFHREPRQFEGGELRIHDAHLQKGAYVSDGTFETIVPQQNRIVFFPCELQHEITAVECPSQLFADSRFTLNGWLRQ
jgi:Rps23 Pro-64 3,4-dihydroxylase Tpa1-like proline 4-hydroxylase